MSRYLPIFLDLRDQPVVVVGGGAVAADRTRRLLEAGARVRLVAPRLTADFGFVPDPHAAGSLARIPRTYRDGDLAGAVLVIVERLPEPVREAVFREARRRGIPVNVHDDPERCTWIAPAVVRRGELQVAISTGGGAPTLAARLRRRLEGELGPGHGRFVALAGGLRDEVSRRHPGFETRRELWYRVVDSEVIARLEGGDLAGAEALAREILGLGDPGAPRPTPPTVEVSP